jgi:hypothetical protein
MFILTWTRGLVDSWTRGLVDSWTRGPVAPWTPGLLYNILRDKPINKIITR